MRVLFEGPGSQEEASSMSPQQSED